jgi:hypothetical protein
MESVGGIILFQYRQILSMNFTSTTHDKSRDKNQTDERRAAMEAVGRLAQALARDAAHRDALRTIDAAQEAPE